ncbi:hypothetical protein SGRA_1624 [Saprospira grandis str. Lewin]|uniref:Uncharacterized protein n=1 Tax=Saprospira grandis (strain Lewin) TaxID=984262 RepID=H6L9Z6_SAPGL|nr:hypothetical protein SGRA_1624 [Saprospira grandis str. Lewin]
MLVYDKYKYFWQLGKVTVITVIVRFSKKRIIKNLIINKINV